MIRINTLTRLIFLPSSLSGLKGGCVWACVHTHKTNSTPRCSQRLFLFLYNCSSLHLRNEAVAETVLFSCLRNTRLTLREEKHAHYYGGIFTRNTYTQQFTRFTQHNHRKVVFGEAYQHSRINTCIFYYTFFFFFFAILESSHGPDWTARTARYGPRATSWWSPL